MGRDTWAISPRTSTAWATCLTHATTRAVTRRDQRIARRQRLLGCAVAALLVFASMTPSHLGRADQPGLLRARDRAGGRRGRCDQPRGQRFHYTDACVERRVQPQAAR